MPLVFAPESGNMLGGTIVNITGPCFNESQKIKCRFENEIVMGTVVDRNRAICVQPFLKYEGYIRFYIAIDSGPYDWKGKYFVGKISLILISFLLLDIICTLYSFDFNFNRKMQKCIFIIHNKNCVKFLFAQKLQLRRQRESFSVTERPFTRKIPRKSNSHGMRII